MYCNTGSPLPKTYFMSLRASRLTSGTTCHCSASATPLHMLCCKLTGTATCILAATVSRLVFEEVGQLTCT